MFTKKLFWVLVLGFLNLVSVDAKERSNVTKILHNSLFTFFADQGKTGKAEI